jgi:prephenate dehydrogenase
MQLNVLTIVGVGLIGGSIGLAARRRGLARHVRGVGRQQASLDQARAIGAVDKAFLDLQSAVPGSDVIVFCTPVDKIAAQILDAVPLCTPGTLLTDAGSTKALIVRAVERRMPAEIAFVGSHPLAGSEKRGPEFADADLFDGRWTVLTSTEATDLRALERTAAFWQALGSRTRVMSPEEHDQALAMTSHLPHLVAAALAGVLPGTLRDLTATGFRDTTRVAGGDPRLWTAIFSHNRAAVLAALELLQERLNEFRRAIAAADDARLLVLLAEAQEVRDALGN